MKNYSIGFSGFLRYSRTAEAAMLLLNTDSDVNEISDKCGFSDTRYMCAGFKELYNCTPSQYRKQYSVNADHAVDERYIDIKDAHDVLGNLLMDHCIATMM